MPSKAKTRTISHQRLLPADRLSQVLEAGATVMAEVGYEAATMTQIAQRAGSSIGTVYHYFKDKPAIVLALRARYGETIEAKLKELEVVAPSFSIEAIAHHFVELAADFALQHPAYFHVIDAPINETRDPKARNSLRACIARIILKKSSSVSHAEAECIAVVVVQISKSLSPLYIHASASGRERILREYKIAMGAYMQERLRT